MTVTGVLKGVFVLAMNTASRWKRPKVFNQMFSTEQVTNIRTRRDRGEKAKEVPAEKHCPHRQLDTLRKRLASSPMDIS